MRNATLVEGPGKQKPGASSEKLGGAATCPPVPTSNSQLQTSSAAELRPGDWSNYLAANPGKREKFVALVAQFHAEVPVFKSEVAEWTFKTIHMAEHGRQIGIAVVELEEMFSGKKLTEDFWQQIEPLFVDAVSGLKITKEQLIWFAKIARANLDPITEIGPARQWLQPSLIASGDPGFHLMGERAPQQKQAEPVPLNELVQLFNFHVMEEKWNRVKADGTSFVDGRLRADLREVLRVDFERPIRLVEEIKKELGL